MQHAPNNNDEWYTPSEYIEAARRVMLTIDVDPASCDEAQKVVQAREYYTLERSALEPGVKWWGNVWMNPPFSREKIKAFTQRLVDFYRQGITSEAIVVTNNGTDTKWFHTLAEEASAICLPRGRISFIHNGERLKGNNKGQVFTYLGRNPELFRREFSRFGEVFVR